MYEGNRTDAETDTQQKLIHNRTDTWNIESTGPNIKWVQITCHSIN
jgi:hypothetical protein